MKNSQSLNELTAKLLPGFGSVLDAERPDVVIVQGDTAAAMSGTLAAYFRKISVAHVEAGLRSDNIQHPWPEEVNRKIIGTFARWHFAPNETAAAALKRENVNPVSINVTGDTLIDALHWVTARIAKKPQLASGLADLEARFASKRIIYVISHRCENFGEGVEAIASAVRRITSHTDVAVVFPVHLNPNVRAVMEERLTGLDNVALIEPPDCPHFARVLGIATLILTDSGGVQEEAPALGKPVLVLRETAERPEGVESGTTRFASTDANPIVVEIERHLDDPAAYQAMAHAHNTFRDCRSARRSVRVLAS